MQMMKVGASWGTYSWTEGFRQNKRLSESEEAKKYPEAVINRLIRKGKWNEAEEVMDKYL